MNPTNLADGLEVSLMAVPFCRALDALLADLGLAMHLVNPSDLTRPPAMRLRRGGIDTPQMADYGAVIDLATEHGCDLRVGRLDRQAFLQAVWPKHRRAATLVTCQRRGVGVEYEGLK